MNKNYKRILQSPFFFTIILIIFSIIVYIFMYFYEKNQRLEFMGESIKDQQYIVQNAKQKLMSVEQLNLKQEDKELAISNAQTVLKNHQDQYYQQIVDYELFKSKLPKLLLSLDE